jgi:predicted DCC family thiol-disulfide oxidoreductase YuxK
VAAGFTGGPVVLFDGVCNLCSASVQFLIARDRTATLRFASLQSDSGRELLLHHKMSSDYARSVVLIERGQVFVESDAALRIAGYLGWPWRLVRFARVLPRRLRDALYRFVADNRYRWFGRTDTCLIPSPAIRSRFL